MHSLDPALQARLEALQHYKIKHPRLQEMDHTAR
jgi:hypothetical protein